MGVSRALSETNLSSPSLAVTAPLADIGSLAGGLSPGLRSQPSNKNLNEYLSGIEDEGQDDDGLFF